MDTNVDPNAVIEQLARRAASMLVDLALRDAYIEQSTKAPEAVPEPPTEEPKK